MTSLKAVQIEGMPLTAEMFSPFLMGDPGITAGVMDNLFAATDPEDRLLANQHNPYAVSPRVILIHDPNTEAGIVNHMGTETPLDPGQMVFVSAAPDVWAVWHEAPETVSNQSQA